MEKPTLMTLAVQCKLCPVCDGTGTRDIAKLLPKKRKEFPCDNCQGQRYVPLVTCRGCGRAAIEWDAVVPYCGRSECWNKLVEIVDPNKVVVRAFPVRMGPGFTVIDNRRRHWDPFKKDFVDSLDIQDRGIGLTPEQEAAISRAMSFGWCDMGDC